MTRDEIIARINEIIIEAGGFDPHRVINPSDSLADDLGMDQLDQVELLMRLEGAFDVSFESTAPQDLEAVKTVQNACDLVIRKLVQQEC